MSIRLTTGSRIAETSSKGNQEKWLADGRWYKLDLFGYEGLAEAMTSALLAQTNTDALGFRYVTFRMERLFQCQFSTSGRGHPDPCGAAAKRRWPGLADRGKPPAQSSEPPCVVGGAD